MSAASKGKAFDLKRVVPPPPPPVKICMACNAFRAECLVPVGEASAPMCWLCAHHVVDHECALHEAATAECECLPHEIYPGRTPPTVDELIQERLRFQHHVEGVDRLAEGGIPDLGALLRASGLCDAYRSRPTVPLARSRVAHCGVCAEEGHYAKTCPTVRRGR